MTAPLVALCTLMSFDGAAAFVSLSPSLLPSLFQLLFFLFPSTESCFRRLSPLYVRDRHTSGIVCVRRVRALVRVPLCLCMSEHFSGVGAAFMSVPSVENGSVSEGQPLAALGFPLCSEEPNAFISCWIFVICP